MGWRELEEMSGREGVGRSEWVGVSGDPKYKKKIINNHIIYKFFFRVGVSVLEGVGWREWVGGSGLEGGS